MLKKATATIAVMMVAAIFAFTLAACSSEETSSSSNESSSSESSASSEATESGSSESSSSESSSSSSSSSDSSVSAIATEDLEESIAVYTTYPEDIQKALADDFKEETGVKVDFVTLEGEMAERVISEKELPLADVILGGDESVYIQLTDEGCLDQCDTTWSGDLSGDFKNADNYWFAVTQTPVQMFYNTSLISGDDLPKDWSDLADESYKDEIVAPDFMTSSMRSWVYNMYYYLDSKDGEGSAKTYLTDLNNNVKHYYNSKTTMYKAVGDGDACLGIGTLPDIISNRDDNGMSIEPINATSGNVIVEDCVAVICNAAHPNSAAAFVEFVGEQSTQEKLSKEYNLIPTLPDALEQSPDWMQDYLTALPCDWSDVTKNSSTWLDEWENSIYSEEKTIEL